MNPCNEPETRQMNRLISLQISDRVTDIRLASVHRTFAGHWTIQILRTCPYMPGQTRTDGRTNSHDRLHRIWRRAVNSPCQIITYNSNWYLSLIEGWINVIKILLAIQNCISSYFHNLSNSQLIQQQISYWWRWHRLMMLYLLAQCH